MLYILLKMNILINGLILVTLSLSSNAVDTSNWMSLLPDNVLLSRLSIPGSHDSCSLYGGDLVKTQKYSLRAQLDAGIRFLDIRARHFRNTLPIHHGMVYQKIKFDNVRDAVIDWLKIHPRETVIMFVKDEYSAKENSRTYEQTFRWYLTGNLQYWYLNNTIPTLRDVRGKIVLVRRFKTDNNSYALGIDATDWRGDTEFDIFRNGMHIKVQDYYNVPTIVFSDLRKKWGRIEQLLNVARKSNDNTWYFNFMSGASSGAYPYSIAKGVPLVRGMNQRLHDYMNKNPKGLIGSIMMDFPEYKDYVIKPIIRRNF